MHPKLFFRVCLFALSRMCHVRAAGQCPAQEPIYWKALKGYTFKILLGSSPFGCLYHCHYEARCQSYNFVIEDKICEMSNRTKEAKPEQFVFNPERFYVKRGTHRVALGSTPSLPAESCEEIKANEAGEAVSGNSWLDPTGSGKIVLAYCDMETGVADFCIRQLCQNGASCLNSHVNYTCLCDRQWTGTYCETFITGKSCRELKEAIPHAPDGMFQLVQPDSGLIIPAYCDMTSFDGGWTMCYTTDEKVNPRTEVTYDERLPYGKNGYRTNCNNIEFREILFVSETTGKKAFFQYQGDHTLVAAENYGVKLAASWNGGGVAVPKHNYQLLICDTPFFTGFFMSGDTKCQKRCDNWCGDTTTFYFRSATSSPRYSGVAFNENGHRALSKKLISVGLR